MSYYRSTSDWWWQVLLFALFVCILVASLIDCNERKACRARGGHVVEYNCHTIFVPMSCGKNCTMIVPERSCDWRCDP